MGWNGSGTFSITYSGNPVVTGTTISSTWANGTLNEVATGLTLCLTKDGQNTPTGNLPMGGYKHTGVGNASAATEYAAYGQVQGATYQLLTSVAGTDTITAAVTPVFSAYAAGQVFRFVVANTNTGAVTININSKGAVAITKQGTNALVAGDIVAGVTAEIIYDGTQFQLVNVTATLDLTLLNAVTLTTGANATFGTATTNGARTVTVTNTNAGSSALSTLAVTADSGTIACTLGSTAAGATASITSTSAGVFNIYTTGASALQLGTNNTPGRLTISSAGAVNAAVSLSENSARVFSRNSADLGSPPAAQTYDAFNKTFTFAHGLGQRPVLVSVWVQCTSTDAGYAVDDCIYIPSGIGTATEYLTIAYDSTNVYVLVAGGIAVTNKGTPSSITALAANKWDIYVRAWY